MTDSGKPFSIHSFLVIFLKDIFSPLATCLMSQQLEYLNQDKSFISPISPKVKRVIFKLTHRFIGGIVNYMSKKLEGLFVLKLEKVFDETKIELIK